MLEAPVKDSTRHHLAATWALFAALALLMLGNGLQSSLIGVRAGIEGFPTVVTGLVMAAYYIGFLAGSWVTPRFVWEVGHIRVYAGLASLASTAALLHIVFVQPATWFAMRLLTGFCLAGLYVVAESWLNGIASNTTRGRLLSVYMVVVMGGLGTGQLLLGVDDPASFELFVLASVLVSLAVAPISLARISAPRVELPSGLPLRELVRIAPLGIAGGAVAGIAGGAVFGMGAVYGAAAGMPVQRIGLFMALLLIGGILFQWPLGSLSDRYPRRWVILGTAAAAAVAAGFAMRLDPASPALLGVGLVFGGLSFPLYSLSLSHVNDVIPTERLMAASAALVFTTGVGSVAGPPLTAGFIDRVGPEGFWLLLAAVNGLFAAYTGYRLIRRRRLEVVERRTWAHVPSRSSVMVNTLLRPAARRRNGRNGRGGRGNGDSSPSDSEPRL